MALIKMGCNGLPQRLGTTAMWLTLVAVVPIVVTAARAAEPPDKVAQEAILEAVYRYQFDHNASGQQSAAGVYCLSLSLVGEKDEDPPSPVVDAFKEHTPPVKPVSACKHSREGVYDRETGKRGVIFYVNHVEFVSDTAAATASGGYYEGGLSSSGNSYQRRYSAMRDADGRKKEEREHTRALLMMHLVRGDGQKETRS